MPVYCFLELAIDNLQIPGKVIFELFDDQVPKTVELFRSLCCADNEAGLGYQGSVFHRVIESFVVQGGDIEAFKINSVNVDIDRFYRDPDDSFLLCSADSSPGPGFFITLRGDNPHLSGKHCVFGKVIRGKDIITQISQVEVDEDDKPELSITIIRCGELEYKGPQFGPGTSGAHARQILNGQDELKPTGISSGASVMERISAGDSSNAQAKKTELKTHRTENQSSCSGHKEMNRHADLHSRPHRRHREPSRSSRRSRSQERSPRYRKKHSRRPEPHSLSRDEEARLARQERLRDYAHYRRPLGETESGEAKVKFKGRGFMKYSEHDKSGDDDNTRYGRL